MPTKIKAKKQRPSGVTGTMTKSGGFRMRAFGPNAPDLRTVIPELLGTNITHKSTKRAVPRSAAHVTTTSDASVAPTREASVTTTNDAPAAPPGRDHP